MIYMKVKILESVTRILFTMLQKFSQKCWQFFSKCQIYDKLE